MFNKLALIKLLANIKISMAYVVIRESAQLALNPFVRFLDYFLSAIIIGA